MSKIKQLLSDREPIEDFEFERELTLDNLLLYKNKTKMRIYNSETGELTQEYTPKPRFKFHNPLEAPPNQKYIPKQCNSKDNYHDSTDI